MVYSKHILDDVEAQKRMGIFIAANEAAQDLLRPYQTRRTSDENGVPVQLSVFRGLEPQERILRFALPGIKHAFPVITDVDSIHCALETFALLPQAEGDLIGIDPAELFFFGEKYACWNYQYIQFDSAAELGEITTLFMSRTSPATKYVLVFVLPDSHQILSQVGSIIQHIKKNNSEFECLLQIHINCGTVGSAIGRPELAVFWQ